MNPEIIKIDDVEYVRADKSKPAGDEVIIRTYSAGVHIGTLKSHAGTCVVLENARRLWKWAGAFTLNEVSQTGINREESRISGSVPIITLTEAVEIIPIAKGVDLSTTNTK